MILLPYLIGGMIGACFAFAALLGRFWDAVAGFSLAVLVAALVALSLCLTGCSTAPRDGWVDIPTDFGFVPGCIEVEDCSGE